MNTSTRDRIFEIHKPRPGHKVMKEVADRWSPRHYLDEAIPKTDLDIIFEAPRWTPSAHNRQPWFFYYVKKGGKSYDKLFSTLDKYNQSWAKTAPLLILACAVAPDAEGENAHAFYDLGAAVFSLVLQAQSLGYYSRQMALFDKNKAGNCFNVEKNHIPYIVIAMGKPGDYDTAPQQIIEYELDSRPRKEHIAKAAE